MSSERRTRMTTTPQAVIGVFQDHSQAEQAVDELLRAGFGNDQIHYSGHGASTAGILDTLKSLFTGQQSGKVYHDLVELGVSPDDASYYQSEFEAGRSILAVLAAGRIQEATGILARFGGYSASRRFAQSGESSPTPAPSVQATGTADEQRLKLREEQLRVQTQPAETGKARVRKDVVSEQQSMEVPVTHEEVYVERRP